MSILIKKSFLSIYMITSFVPLAASVSLTAQHLACAASCQEGPDFSFRQGVGEGTDVWVDTWRGFCQMNKAISLAATAAGCLAAALLGSPFLLLQQAVGTRWPARQGQLSIGGLLCALWPARASQT